MTTLTAGHSGANRVVCIGVELALQAAIPSWRSTSAELYDKLAGFVGDMQTIGARLKQAREAYDSAEAKLATGRGNVIRQAEMLRSLGVKPGKGLPPSLIATAHDDDESVLKADDAKAVL